MVVGSGQMSSERAVDRSTTELENMLFALQDHNGPAKDPLAKHRGSKERGGRCGLGRA
jgi:hypothetical protein